MRDINGRKHAQAVPGAVVVAGLLAILLAGCMVDRLKDGPKPGDFSRHVVDDALVVMEKRAAYCAKAEGNPLRATALAAIRFYLPLIPADGICGPKLATLDGIVTMLSTANPPHEKDPQAAQQ